MSRAMMSTSRAGVVAVFVALTGCNNLLGIKDLSNGEVDANTAVDASTDGESIGNASVRFLLVTPDAMTVSPDAPLAIHVVGGDKIAEVSFGQLTNPTSLPRTADEIELRSTIGDTLYATADGLNLQSPFMTIVIAGLIQPGDGADRVRLLSIDESQLSDNPNGTTLRVVNAIADDTDAMSAAIYSDVAGQDEGVGFFVGPRFFASQETGEMLSANPSRLQIGTSAPSLQPQWGSGIVSFTLPAMAPGTKAIAVLGGNLHAARADIDPALALFVVSTAGGMQVIKQDVIHYFANFISDGASQPWSISDPSGIELHPPIDTSTKHTLVFVPPGRSYLGDVLVKPMDVFVDAVDPGPGWRRAVLVHGWINRTIGEPGVRADEIDVPDVRPGGLSAVRFIHASPDIGRIDVEIGTSQIYQVDLPYGASFDGTIEPATSVSVRLHPPGNTSSTLASFTVPMSARRQFLVLSGTLNPSGARESLRVTPVLLDRWPWPIGAPILRQ